MKKFKIVIHGTGTTSVAGRIKYLKALLRGESLREFEDLESQVLGTTNSHLNFIKEGLLGYFIIIHALSNQKRAMLRARCKPRYLPFKRFAAWLIKLKTYLSLFPISSPSKNIPPEELNKIVLHNVPNRWKKKAYIQGWDFEGSSYKEACDMF